MMSAIFDVKKTIKEGILKVKDLIYSGITIPE